MTGIAAGARIEHSLSSNLPYGQHCYTTTPCQQHTPTMSSQSNSDVPLEVQQTLTRLSAYKNVRGILITARASGGIVQQSGTAFEGEKGKEYGRVVAGMVAAVSMGVGQLDEGVSRRRGFGKGFDAPTMAYLVDIQDDLRLMRLRTKRHELIVTPGECLRVSTPKHGGAIDAYPWPLFPFAMCFLFN